MKYNLFQLGNYRVIIITALTKPRSMFKSCLLLNPNKMGLFWNLKKKWVSMDLQVLRIICCSKYLFQICMLILLALSSALNFTEKGTCRITATLHSKQCTQHMKMMLCTLPTVHSVHSTCTMKMMLCTLPTIHSVHSTCTMQMVLCTLPTVHSVHSSCKMQMVHCALPTVHSVHSTCTVHVQCRWCTVLFQLYTLYTEHIQC